MSSPRVCPFMGSNVNSASSSVISVNTSRIKKHSWAVSLVSVDSSNCSAKHSQSAASLYEAAVSNCSAFTPQRCVTVLLDSWKALIDGNFCSLFLKSRNKESAASMKASYIISPSWKDFFCLMMEWLTRSDASLSGFDCEFHCVKKDCCPISCDFASLTFLFLSSLFGGKSVSYFLWTFQKCLSTFPFFGNSDGSLTNLTNALWKRHGGKKSPPPTFFIFFPDDINWSH